MLKRDFIMVQIEELGKVIAQLILWRNTHTDATRKNAMIRQVYTSLDTDPQFLLETSAEQIHRQMDQGGRSGLLRMEIAAKALIEESFLNPVQKEPFLRKAKALLEYVQMRDNTFSLERIETISEIDALLA